MGTPAAAALQIICVPTSTFKFVSWGLKLGPFPSVPVRVGLGLPGCWIPVCPKGMFAFQEKNQKCFSHFLGQQGNCFSEQLRRVGSCCWAVGWCQGATPFGVPIKTGVGVTSQEADHREWSLPMCRTWSLGSVLLLAPRCMHMGRGFSGKERGTGLSCPCCRYKFSGQALPCAGSLFPGTLPSSSRCSYVP